jgi:hypothetical protein
MRSGPAVLVVSALLASACASARSGDPAPPSLGQEPTETERSACLDSAAGSVSLKPLGQAAGFGLMSSLWLAAQGAADGVQWGIVTGGRAGDGAWIGAAVGAGLGLTIGLVMGVVEGVKAHRTYVGAYERCLSEQTASLAEPYPSPDIDEVKPAP